MLQLVIFQNVINFVLLPFGDIRELLPKPPKLRPFYIESIKGFL